MAKKKKKKTPGFLARLVDAVLSLIDWLCEGIASLAVALINGLLTLVRLLLLGAWKLVCLAVRVICWPFSRLWRLWRGRRNRAWRCLKLSGGEFEAYVAEVLKDNGFKKVQVTKGSGDQGADVLAERNGISYAIQCKNYEGSVGNYAVQEAYAAAQFYGCDRAAVICPGEFTRGAKELAEATDVTLWDGAWLSRAMKRSGRRPKHREG
ncbi:MAG: restriction endonuclease [Clostridia bacterium]|nr:restriction endonuclease [Clostridia bacterium]